MENGFRLSGSALGKLVKSASPAYGARNSIPILSTARVSWADGQVELSLTNLDMQIDASVDAETFGTAKAQIPYYILTWLCSAAGDQMLNLSLNAQGAVPRIDATAGSLHASFNLLSDPADFPQMQDEDQGGEIVASQADLLRLVTKSRGCISTEETRYYLNGVYFHGADGKARAVSTDGHRLARIDSDVVWPDDTAGVIIPTRAIDALRYLMNAKANSPITLNVGPKQIRAKSDGWCLTAKVIDDTYPDYTRVIPKADPTSHVTVGHAGLRPQLTLPMFGHQSGPITFDTAAKVAQFRSPDGEVDASVPIEASGQDLRIGFNRIYLGEFTRSEGTLRLALTSPGDPAAIYVADPAALFVLMPMRI